MSTVRRSPRHLLNQQDVFPSGIRLVAAAEPVRDTDSKQRMDPMTGLPTWRVQVRDNDNVSPHVLSVEIAAPEKPQCPPVGRQVLLRGLTVEGRTEHPGPWQWTTWVLCATSIIEADSSTQDSPASQLMVLPSEAGDQGSDVEAAVGQSTDTSDEGGNDRDEAEEEQPPPCCEHVAVGGVAGRGPQQNR